MNETQLLLKELQGKGWSSASISDQLGVNPHTIHRWRWCIKNGEQRVLPLVLDLTNPSPALGWAHAERMSLVERGPAGLVLALVVVHYMAIGNNVPLERVASFLASLAPWLVVEFVPPEDPKAQQLLVGREDIFSAYTQTGFEAAFKTYFKIEAIENIQDSHRTLSLSHAERIMGKAQLLAPTLAAAFPILFLYAHNISQVTASLVVPVLLVAVGVATVLTLILWRAFRNGAQTSLVATVWVLLFFLYGHFYDAMNGIAIWGIVLGTHQILLPLALIVAALALLPALLRQTPELGFMSYTTVVLALLVILNLASIATTETRRLGQASTGPDPIEGIGSGGSDSSQLPDIYYIVPDRYPSSSTLEEYFGYDNSEFIEFLEDSGFYIANESFANYHQTFLSLASSLNMEYLDGLSREVGENTSDKTPAYAMLEDNRVWRILKEQYGYSFIHFGSWWAPTGNNPHADVRINKYPRLFGLVEMDNHFFKLLLQTSLLAPFQDSILRQDYFQQDESEVERCRGLKAKTQHPPNNEVEGQCHRTLHTFEQLKEMPSVEGPKFVFVHLLIPHPPFVFGPDGEVVEPPPFYYWDPLSDDEIEILKRSKLDQLAFTNRKLKETIDHILAKSQRPPVIILQADEGPWTAEYIQESPENWTTETLRIRHRILNAYYLPDEAEAHLYPSISPVNTFRVIFNEYLRADLPLLEDKAYMSKSPDRPYSFIEVTGQVKYGVIDAEE